METTPKLDSPLLVGTPMNYAFAFAMNYCVRGFDANYYVDLMLKLCKCLHIAVLHETCLKPFLRVRAHVTATSTLICNR
jgi:hypothetical protein